MNKKITLVIIWLAVNIAGLRACEVCVKQQPKILQGFTHGTGPDSNFDYLIVSVMAALVCATLFFSMKWLISPGERSSNHIKFLIHDTE
jgi:hypothetical protein